MFDKCILSKYDNIFVKLIIKIFLNQINIMNKITEKIYKKFLEVYKK